jgi:hypothetical protein
MTLRICGYLTIREKLALFRQELHPASHLRYDMGAC